MIVARLFCQSCSTFNTFAIDPLSKYDEPHPHICTNKLCRAYLADLFNVSDPVEDELK